MIAGPFRTAHRHAQWEGIVRVKRTTVGLLAGMALLAPIGWSVSSEAGAANGPRVSIGDQSGLERDEVIGSVFMPVTLSEAATEPVIVSYYTVNDTAVYIPPEDRDDPEIFGDYQRRGTPEEPRSVTVPAGALQTTINIPVNIDDEVEDDEQFSVVIASVSGGDAEIGDDTGIATIIDSDGLAGPNPVLHVTDTAIHEGDVGQRRTQFQVHLSRAPVSNVTISYTTSAGSAQPGQDYTEKFPGSVVFAPGQISKTIDVLVASNTSIGEPRDFRLNVTVTGGSPVEERSTVGVGTILDDDQPAMLPIVPVVSAGNDHTCALNSQGVVKCWGSGVLGQLGTGSTTSSLTPVTVTALPPRIASIVTGDSHTCALTETGGVKCWGNNANGQLGIGSTVQQSLPTDVPGLTSGVTLIAAGDNHTCAVLGAGGVKCWGWGTSGQLGQNGNSSNLPVDVSGLPAGVAVTSIDATYRHTCVSLADGSARCWGRNHEGQIGTGTASTTLVRTAVQPVGLASGVTHVSTGGSTTCVVQDDRLKCFGLGTSGQLGNNASVTSATPVLVADADDYAHGAVGGNHSCGLTASGAAKCWGLNQEGQLGVNQLATALPLSRVPLQVNGLGSGQISVSSGIQHSCSMAADESVRCWGLNTNGQLGNGTTARSITPVLVTGL